MIETVIWVWFSLLYYIYYNYRTASLRGLSEERKGRPVLGDKQVWPMAGV